MKILIIEDETRAANRIKRLLAEIKPDIEIIGVLESVTDGVEFLKSHSPELIISDIQLADGLSFEIFKSQAPKCPIIFTTAYDQYAIQAFDTNGIDYLLKPIEKSRLEQALDKLDKLSNVNIENEPSKFNFEQLIKLSLKSRDTRTYKSRFMIKVGEKIKSIPISDITVFYSLEKGTFIHTVDNRNYNLDYSLEQIVEMLNPTDFFKINRKYIVNLHAAKDIIVHSNSRLKLVIKGFESESLIVAREKVTAFKMWLDQ